MQSEDVSRHDSHSCGDRTSAGILKGGRIQREERNLGGAGAAAAAAGAACWPVEPRGGSAHSFLQDFSDVKGATQRLDC